MYGKGTVIRGLNARRGTSIVRACPLLFVNVALSDIFGYSNQLYGATQGKSELQLAMEYKYKVP